MNQTHLKEPEIKVVGVPQETASPSHTDHDDDHDHGHALRWRDINRVLFVAAAAGAIWFLDSGEYHYVKGQLRRNRERVTVLGLNENHNHDLKNIFKSAAISASTRSGPFQEFYAGLLAKGRRPAMARLTLARKIAAITLTIWKKGVCFDANELHRQAA